MLPRVSAALAQFITPLVSSAAQASVQKEAEFKRFQKKSDQKKKKEEKQAVPQTELKLVHPASASSDGPQAPAETLNKSGATSAFLQLFDSLKAKRTFLMHWLGGRAYQATAQAQKRKGTFRKGTMLDEKAE